MSSPEDRPHYDTDRRMADVLERFQLRLEARFVSRAEFEALRPEVTSHGTSIALLSQGFEEMSHKLDKITEVIARVGWAISLSVLAAVLALVLR